MDTYTVMSNQYRCLKRNCAIQIPHTIVMSDMIESPQEAARSPDKDNSCEDNSIMLATPRGWHIRFIMPKKIPEVMEETIHLQFFHFLCAILDEQNRDWPPQTNYLRAHYKDLDTPNPSKSSFRVTSLGDKDQ